MSYAFNVSVKKARLPDAEELRRRLEARGRLKLPETLDVLQAEGFFALTLDGKDTGFEVFVGEITDQRREAYRQDLQAEGMPEDEHYRMLLECDLTITLSGKDRREAQAARIVATALASAAGGWFCDPQTGEEKKV